MIITLAILSKSLAGAPYKPLPRGLHKRGGCPCCESRIQCENYKRIRRKAKALMKYEPEAAAEMLKFGGSE